MNVKINPESRFVDFDPEIVYDTPAAVMAIRLACPDCGATVIPAVMKVGTVANMARFQPGRRWRCNNGHGSPNHL